jgi:hypothetical protein
VKERPAAVRALDRAQINADLALELGLDPVEIMLEQNIFRRDRRIRLEREDEMPVRP